MPARLARSFYRRLRRRIVLGMLQLGAQPGILRLVRAGVRRRRLRHRRAAAALHALHAPHLRHERVDVLLHGAVVLHVDVQV